eukprot:2604487-Lingulodinium_polyedra.AAC.1
MGHILERSANNIGNALNPQHGRLSHTFVTDTFHTSDYHQIPSEDRAHIDGHFSAETRGLPSAVGPAMP